jgi:hypothetical protein
MAHSPVGEYEVPTRHSSDRPATPGVLGPCCGTLDAGEDNGSRARERDPESENDLESFVDLTIAPPTKLWHPTLRQSTRIPTQLTPLPSNPDSARPLGPGRGPGWPAVGSATFSGCAHPRGAQNA